MDYNPNKHFDDEMTVRVTFGAWEYRKTIDVTVGGNSRGLDIIDCAVSSIYDELEENYHGIPTIYLTTPEGGELECSDDEDRGEDWLKEMVVSAEITSLKLPFTKANGGGDE